MKLDQSLYKYFYQCGTIENCHDKQDIYLEEDLSHGIYLVVEGKVRVYLLSQDGLEVTIEILEAGSVFGTSSMITDSTRPVNVAAIGDTRLIHCPLERFYPYFQESPQLAIAFIQLISNSCDHLTNLIKKERFYDRYQKVAAFLLEKQHRNAISNYSHEEIATIVGKNRVTVSKVLNDFTNDDLIIQSYRTIKIKNLAKLREVITSSRH